MKIEDIWYYDETSPTRLRWKIDRWVGRHLNVCIVAKGDVAGSSNGLCYQVKYKTMYCKVHRIIWSLFNGDIPDNMVIDHLDGNPMNNTISNLSLKSFANNSRNRKKSNKNKSGETGVSLHLNKYWKAQWYENGKLCVKYFNTDIHGEEEAKNLATKYRYKMINELIDVGYMYTERHGT